MYEDSLYQYQCLIVYGVGLSRKNPFTVIHLFWILQPCLGPIHIAAAFGKPIVSTSILCLHHVTIVSACTTQAG
jgi:hypothetical protein